MYRTLSSLTGLAGRTTKPYYRQSYYEESATMLCIFILLLDVLCAR